MDTLWQDLRYGARTLARSPGFTLVAVLTLALGIGANTALFSVVNAVLLRPLPYHDPDRLVLLWNSIPSAGVRSFPLSPPEFTYYREHNPAFEQLAAYTPGDFNLTGGDRPERVPGARVSADLFSLLGVEAIRGRTFLVEEHAPGNDQVVLLSEGLWKRRFGSDPELLGQAVTLDGVSRIVVGILPEGFRFPGEVDLWVPMAVPPEQLGPGGLGRQFARGLARLKTNTTLLQAQEAMNRTAAGFYQQYPFFYEEGDDWTVTLVPLHQQLTAGVRLPLLVLLGAVGFVLLIACANVANLLLTRATARQREIAVRTALGAGRARLGRQLVTESLLLALLGGLAGLLMASWGLGLLLRLLPAGIPRAGEIAIDGTVLAFTLGASLVVGILFGAAPAFYALKTDPQAALRGGPLSPAGAGGNRRFRSLLVITEVALALVLAIGTGLLAKSFLRLQQVDPGFNPENLLSFRLSPSPAHYPEKQQLAAFFQDVVERVGALPGVISVGGTSALPLSGQDNRSAFTVEGEVPPGADSTDIHFRTVTGAYWQTMGIPLLKGRWLNETDDQTAPLALVVNQATANRLWPDRDPLGRRISFLGPEGPWYSVVGVVANVKHTGLNAGEDLTVFMSYAQAAPFLPRNTTLVVRTPSDPAALAAAIRSQVSALDPNQPIYDMRTMTEVVSASLAQPRFNLLLLGLFSVLALTLAAVGIYGVISYSVSQRVREIGIRMALGARERDVFRLVLTQGLGLAGLGILLGLLGALGLTRLLASLLFGVTPTDLLTYVGVSLFLIAVAALAAYLPARRATRVDPMTALRYE